MNIRPDSQRLYELAEGQGGYFGASQAQELGFGSDLISYHAKRGNFLRAARGIYRFKRFPASPFEDLIVACLRAGPRAAVSHETALAVYGLSDLMPAQIHLIVPRTKSRRLRGLKLHRHRLGEDEVTRRGVSEEQVDQAVREALQHGLVQRHELLSAAQSRGGRAKEVIGKALSMAVTPK